MMGWQFFSQAECHFCRPTNGVKALKVVALKLIKRGLKG